MMRMTRMSTPPSSTTTKVSRQRAHMRPMLTVSDGEEGAEAEGAAGNDDDDDEEA